MVVQDAGGGRISAVNYGSKDPITKTLQTFAIDLTENPTLADLLDQIRGERVEFDAPDRVAGVILGVERRAQQIGEEKVIEVEYLNLLTDDGLRSVALNQVGRIRIMNESLDAELRQALTILATSHSTDKKTVQLRFDGAGERPVRVGYIQESPVWKTSYRLVVDDDTALLQGWAIVENTSDADWSDVSLTLVSGRPISFLMDLYEPLYVPRPTVVPDLFASLMPQTYDDDLARRAGRRGGGFGGGGQGGQRGKFRDLSQNGVFSEGQAREADAAAPAAAPAMGGRDAQHAFAFTADSMKQAAAAQGGDVGELFQYTIDLPVTLPRQQSAMLPIANQSVDVEKVSIYNPAVHAKHPLNGLRLTNSTGLHLMQGPITVYDDGAYAGDAQIDDLPPDADRLISYALDLNVEVAPEQKPRPEQITQVRFAKGVLQVTRKYSQLRTYRVVNSDDKDRTVLVEHPVTPGWNLVTPEEPAEKTRSLYRFAVNATPAEPAELTVHEELVQSQSVSANNLNQQTVGIYLKSSVTSDAVKQALSEIIKRKIAIEQLNLRNARLAQDVNEIAQDQDRIRKNMGAIDRNSEIYRRYVKKFTDQETDIEKHRAEADRLTVDIAKLSKDLDQYILGLNLE